MCRHQQACPTASAPDRTAARVVATHPEQGWSLLCNGVILFDDAGVLLPNGPRGTGTSSQRGKLLVAAA